VVLAPQGLRSWLLEHIERQAALGPRGLIRFKVNALVDPEVIDALYDASAAGTRVQGVVRGLCSLRAGVEGLSETIAIRSIVGSFLEHSRIYVFGDGAEAVVAIASADLMQRNLDRRVELLLPIDDPEHRARLLHVLEVAFADDTHAWELSPEGTWRRVRTTAGISLQRVLNTEAEALR
jgi:polyphosphate kinase